MAMVSIRKAIRSHLHLDTYCYKPSNLRNDIKSYGKFTIFSKLKIEGGWVKMANFGKIKTKDRRP